MERLPCSRSSARRGSASASSSSSPRSSSARWTGRLSCGAGSVTSGSPSPSRTSTRGCRIVRRWTACHLTTSSGPSPQRLPCPPGDRRGRHALRVRRPPPVHEDGDPVHPRRPDHLPGRCRGDGPAWGRAGPGRRGRRSPDRPADRDAWAPARPQHRLRSARLRYRCADGLHDRPCGVPGRPADRPEDHPGERPVVDRGLHVPPEWVRACTAPPPEECGRRDPVGRPGSHDRRRVRPAVRLGRHPRARHGAQAVARQGGGRDGGPHRHPLQGRRDQRGWPAIDGAVPGRRPPARRRQGVAGPGPVDRAHRLRRVHAADRQARPRPGHRLGRLRGADRRHHHHLLPTAPPGLDAPRPDGRLGIVWRSDRYVDVEREFGRLLDQLVAVRRPA